MLIGLIIQTCKQKKCESVADFKVGLEALFLWHSGLHAINVTQPTLAALFINGLAPEISGLIKRQKIGWETTSLTELMTIPEHF